MLYIVIYWHYSLPFHYYEVVKIFKDKKRADKVAERLNKKNDRPPERDSYGAYGGGEYKVWKRKLDK